MVVNDMPDVTIREHGTHGSLVAKVRKPGEKERSQTETEGEGEGREGGDEQRTQEGQQRNDLEKKEDREKKNKRQRRMQRGKKPIPWYVPQYTEGIKVERPRKPVPCASQERVIALLFVGRSDRQEQRYELTLPFGMARLRINEWCFRNVPFKSSSTWQLCISSSS